MIAATAILAGVAGFFIGQGASIGVFSSSPHGRWWGMTAKAPAGYEASDEELESEEEEDEDGDEKDGGALATFEGNTDEVKLVLVVRTDLGMGKGAVLSSFLFVVCVSEALSILVFQPVAYFSS